MKIQKKKLGELLVEHKLITQQQLMDALVIQRNTGKKLGEVLISQGLLTESVMMIFLQHQLGVAFADLNKIKIDPKLVSYVSLSIAQRYTLVPIALENGKLEVAMEDPLDFVALEDLKRAVKFEIVPLISFRESIKNAIRQLYRLDFAEKAVKEYSGKESVQIDEASDTTDNLLDEVSNAPIVRLLESVLELAIQLQASDIHIEPLEKDVRFRIRVDGTLKTELTVPKDLHQAIVTRVKIIGGLNIAEKRLPQDGRVEYSILGKRIDQRISVMPTWLGEKVVIRLLDRGNFFLSKDKLGFTNDNVLKFDELIKNPHGLILVVGPTGSGKTTTLYAMLNELNKESSNIITIEDPVEYVLKGVNQTQVNVKAGLTFALGLRALLRQDPDIVMVGEIRDGETTDIAVRAAITGHLVLSTLHTNDAVSSIARLMDMGVDNYLLAASLVGVISQRLVKRVCNECKKIYKPQPFECAILGITLKDETVYYKGQGCSLCNFTGYKGRLPVHEVMILNRRHVELISRKAHIDEIREHSINSGMSTLMNECLKLLDAGLTSVEEVLKIAFTKEG